MRKLEELEKNFILSIIDLHERKSLNVLSNILTNRRFLNFTEKGFYLKINDTDIKLFLNQDTEDISFLNELSYYINRYIILIIDFIKYLESNSYIIVLPLTHDETVKDQTIGMEINNKPGVGADFIFKSGKQDFIKYANSVFVVKNNLIDLKENEFIEESDRKYLKEREDIERQFSKTNIGLTVTIIALIFSTYFNIKNLNKNKDLNVQKIKIINDAITFKNINNNVEHDNFSEKNIKKLIHSIESIRVYQECNCDNESLK